MLIGVTATVVGALIVFSANDEPLGCTGVQILFVAYVVSPRRHEPGRRSRDRT